MRWRAPSALISDFRAAAWLRTPLFGVARCDITAGDMAGSIDRLTVGPRDPRRHCSFHRIAGIARRPCGVDLPERRVAGHCPGDETAAAVHLVDLALRLGRDRIGGINAGGPHRGTEGSNPLPSSEESCELRYGPRRPACDPYAPYGRFPKRRSCRSTQEGAVADKNVETVAIIRAGIAGIYLRPNWALPASSCASKISMRGTSCGSTATRSLRWLASRYRDIRLDTVRPFLVFVREVLKCSPQSTMSVNLTGAPK